MLIGAASSVAVTPFGPARAEQPKPLEPATPQTPQLAFSEFELTVNGAKQPLKVDPRTTLLDACREHLGLIGPKKGCDHGQCGACTMLVNGRRINSCLTFAVMHRDDEIVTVEGLGDPMNMHPMQAAFVRHDGFQCGYCTPGQICSAVGMLQELKDGVPSHVTGDLLSPEATATEVRERMSGNICRCGAYSNIIEAISEVGGVKA